MERWIATYSILRSIDKGYIIFEVEDNIPLTLLKSQAKAIIAEKKRISLYSVKITKLTKKSRRNRKRKK